ncbi:MAG: hypothetical protein WAK27_12515 [Candidatus Sulfotelmatobacter sp.]
MKKTVLTFLLCALFASASSLHAADCSTTAGGVPVVIPPPAKEFAEVGSDRRDFFEYMVPSRNRLLCAFVPADFLPRLKNPARGLGQYMLVELSRRLDEKNTEVTSASFEKVVSGMKQQFADSSTLDQTVQTTSEEISRKLKQLDSSTDISIDKPTPLGTLFQTSDAYASAMLAPVSSGGVTMRTINASVLLRVRNRLIFAYIYGSSDDENSLRWIEKMAEQWANEILTANSKSPK